MPRTSLTGRAYFPVRARPVRTTSVPMQTTPVRNFARSTRLDGSSYASVRANPAQHAWEAPAIDPADAALQRPARQWCQRLVQPACFVLAALLHLSLFAWLLPATSDAFGDGGLALEAIAVDLVDTLPSTASPLIAAAAAADPTPAPVADRELAEKEPEAQPEAARETTPAIEEAAARPPVERETRDREEATPQPPPADAQPASIGAVATGEASPGVVHAYGARIAKIISQGRPRGTTAVRARGKVLLQFVVDPEGRIASAEVKQSSGSPELDNRALTTLQKLSFPRPTPDMSERQRNFTVPYDFK